MVIETKNKHLWDLSGSRMGTIKKEAQPPQEPSSSTRQEPPKGSTPKDSQIEFTCKGGRKYLLPAGAKVSNKSAQIRMIRAEAVGQAELLAAAINRPQIVPPKFSGRQEEWPTLEKEWEEYLRASRLEGDGELSLSLLKKVMDDTTKLRIETRRNTHPQESYKSYGTT